MNFHMEVLSESFCKELNEDILDSLPSLHSQVHLKKEMFHTAHGKYPLFP